MSVPTAVIAGIVGVEEGSSITPTSPIPLVESTPPPPLVLIKEIKMPFGMPVSGQVIDRGVSRNSGFVKPTNVKSTFGAGAPKIGRAAPRKIGRF